MRWCPHCHSSVVIDYRDLLPGEERPLKCLACGRLLTAADEERSTVDRVPASTRSQPPAPGPAGRDTHSP